MRSSGLENLASRWGVKGSNEVSDGLKAVYKFETAFSTTDASQKGRLAYAGLSGGFGTIVGGRIWSASDSHVGAILDNSLWLGDDELTGRHGDVLSYSADVGTVSFQVDVQGNKGGGWSETATRAATAAYENKDIDSSQMGATIALGENGKIALAHISRDARMDADDKQNAIAGEYTVGGMTAYLGFSKREVENKAVAQNDATGVEKFEAETTFFGVRGGVGDTGIAYLLQVRNKKASGELGNGTKLTDTNLAAATNDEAAQGANQISKYSPWYFSLSRSLGGGTSIALEHANPDEDDRTSQTALILRVGF